MTEDEKTEWFSEDTATFGDRLAAAREAVSMPQKDLAKKLGVKLGTLRNWEDDLNEPRANKLQMVSGILGVSIRWLLTGEGDGVEAPDDSGVEPADLRAILAEMRSLRAQIAQSGEKLSQLEKRLRAVLSDVA
ncbi:helix-turn-helix domain-containing protein [Salibaculum halophilum]|jgi:transcriptional regulator with XRE-family HTH domain|uniref:helix-turn-helix domain-containing protein n=1 Tax=Salibaculum halophilum TaxID=1914408 RepID=UPI000A0F436B|nr:helix-turn-helix domain-containing protein [Salibaculum halophilum]